MGTGRFLYRVMDFGRRFPKKSSSHLLRRGLARHAPRRGRGLPTLTSARNARYDAGMMHTQPDLHRQFLFLAPSGVIH